MHRRINLFVVLGILVCITVVFLCINDSYEKRITELQSKSEQNRVKLISLDTEQTQLKQSLENADTDAFVESQARSQYGYMKRDEIRFVITNPEVLYGTENIPFQ